MLRSVIGASVRFRFLLIAVASGFMVFAVAWLPGIHSDVLPEMSPVVVRIQTEAPGLSAPEVESLVTVPLEKNLLEGVMDVTDVTSDSIPGLSQIELDFAPGTNLYLARQLVQERLTQAFVLPNVSKPPVMLQPVSSTGNVMLIGLTSRQLSLVDLSVLARWTIVPRLLGVPGVADVSTFGEADRQLQVLVDPARLAAHHITLAQIIETAGNAQLVSPLSYLQGSTPGTGGFLEGPNQRLTIQPVLPFGTPANLGQVPVAGTTGNRPVPLGSVTGKQNSSSALCFCCSLLRPSVCPRRFSSQRRRCGGQNAGAQCPTTDAACGIPRDAAVCSRKRSHEQACGDACTRRRRRGRNQAL